MLDPKVVAVIAWPAVALILGAIALIMFRNEVRRFLGRAQSIGKGWVVAAPAEQQAIKAPDADSVREFLDSFSGEVIRLQEQSIRDDLSARNMDGHPELEKVLVRSLAATQVALHFEQIHAIIWDGQVQLLEILNTVPDGIDRDELQSVYEAEFRQKREFYKDIEFATYIQWLFEKTLIREDDGKLQLTVLGREYLKWLVENGRTKRGVG